MAGIKGMKGKKKHEDSPRFAEYYQKQNPEWSKEQCENKAKWFRRSCNYQCIEYYEKNYPELSHDKHIELKQQIIEQKRQNSDTNIKYWKKRYPEKSIEELEKLRSKASKEKNKCNIEYWIKRNPNKSIEEVKELHKKFFDIWLSHQEGWGKGDKNPNSKHNTTQEHRNSMSPRNIAFYERKYPDLSHEEHLKLQQTFFEKNRKAIKNAIKDTNIEYYLNQGMSEEEAKKALHDRQATFTLEKCIKKYGEIDGLKKFNERQQKWLKSLQQNFAQHGDGRSVQSQLAQEIFSECCCKLNIDYPKKEKYIYDIVLNKAWAYDFQYNNKIIEFNGDYWHCNPRLYAKDFYNKVKQKTAEQIWLDDKQKIECANRYNYKVLTIWELDYNEDPDKEIQKCIDFLIND